VFMPARPLSMICVDKLVTILQVILPDICHPSHQRSSCWSSTHRVVNYELAMGAALPGQLLPLRGRESAAIDHGQGHHAAGPVSAAAHPRPALHSAGTRIHPSPFSTVPCTPPLVL
jgi:hypothetical protein